MQTNVEMSCSTRGVSLQGLIGIFGQTPSALGRWVLLPAEELPDPYAGLLVHHGHMTTTVERHHGQRVRLRVLDERRRPDYYARKILLELEETGSVAEFAIMRCDVRRCKPKVRDIILEGKTSLGRILIEHEVLRHISPERFLRVTPAAELREYFGLKKPRRTYARLATIYCERGLSVDLLEVLAPESVNGRQTRGLPPTCVEKSS
jgi:chorismate-pyruvate lyase